MLHELLLALSGCSSLILNNERREQSFGSLLSPSENDLLTSLSRLGSLQADIRERASFVSASHSSMVCRAVSTSVVSTNLAGFLKKVLDVEQGILQQDARYVGAYDIVPLSGIAGAFSGWCQVLEWLRKLMLFIQAADGKESRGIRSGAQVIDWLRREAQTGYPDLERVAISLIAVAEVAWLRQLSAWILYGRLPLLGADDFFIQRDASSTTAQANYKFVSRLCPSFVTLSTANSILFIGRSLNLVHERGLKLLNNGSHQSVGSAHLLSAHLTHLSSIKHPIAASSLSRIIGTIRSSLAQNALKTLLPTTSIIQIFDILRYFFLLGKGEFAIALIAAADDCLSGRHLRSTVDPRHKDAHRLGGIMIKEGEVTTVLRKAWVALMAAQNTTNDEDSDDGTDDDLDMARDLIHLSIKKAKPNPSSSTNATVSLPTIDPLFDDVLLGTPTTLSLTIPSPLDLFLTPSDIETYSLVNAYLISLRRTHIHLSDLWRCTVLRRNHPSPPQIAGSQSRAMAIATVRREGGNDFARRMRGTWAAVSAATFFFAELEDYLQGEVVAGSWGAFRRWLQPASSSPSPRKSTTTKPESSTIDTTSQFPPSPPPHHDPELLSLAHRTYLSSLTHALLLTDQPFTSALRSLLTLYDHLVALIRRLAVVRQGVEAKQLAAPSDQAEETFLEKEEKDLMESLADGGRKVRDGVKRLEKRLREVDMEKGRGGRGKGGVGIVGGARKGKSSSGDGDVGEKGGGLDREEVIKETGFVPWRGGGVESLLARLEIKGEAE